MNDEEVVANPRRQAAKRGNKPTSDIAPPAYPTAMSGASLNTFQRLGAFNCLVRPSATLMRRDLPLSKTPKGAILRSESPGIGGMSVKAIPDRDA